MDFDRTEFKVCHLVALSPWESHLNCPVLNSLIHEMEITIALALENC